MLKKIFPVLILAILGAYVVTDFEHNKRSIMLNTSDVFAGIYAASVWNSNNASWNKKASRLTSAGALVGGACMKAALVGSGAGPVGAIVCSAAVGL